MAEKIWICDDAPSQRYPVYTRGNVGEVFTEAVSPLTWSALGPHSWELGWRDAFYEMGVFTPDEFKPEGESEVTCCFGGYVYINMSVTRVMAVRIPGLTVEAIDASLFGDYPGVPAYKPDPRDQNAERTAGVSAWLTSLFTGRPQSITDLDRTRIDALIAHRPHYMTLSNAQLLERFRSIIPENRHQFKRHVLNSYGANVLVSIIAQVAQAVDAGHLAAKVTAAIGDVDSAGQSYELWALSRTVRSSPAFNAAFDHGADSVLERIRACDDTGGERFFAQWNEFLERWGFLGPNVWELRSPTYRSNPEIALRMLERLRNAPDSSAPSVRAATLASEREAAIAEIARRLSGNAEAINQFMGAARGAGNYMAARERSKMQCALVIEEARAPLRILGERLVELGLLARWEHLLLLTNDEVDDFIVDAGAYAGLIAERNARLELLMSKEPPFVFEGNPLPLSAFKDRDSGMIEIASAGARLRGLGVSPGTYTGRARVITSLNTDSELQPGEVIVAAITDASWGPLFLTAGAVVVETGAAVSHAAIVSRELGIPAAVSVAGATRRIRNGAMVTVDGNTGSVVVH